MQLVTTREMQLTLKMVLNKIDVQNFDQKLGIVGMMVNRFLNLEISVKM